MGRDGNGKERIGREGRKGREMGERERRYKEGDEDQYERISLDPYGFTSVKHKRQRKTFHSQPLNITILKPTSLDSPEWSMPSQHTLRLFLPPSLSTSLSILPNTFPPFFLVSFEIRSDMRFWVTVLLVHSMRRVIDWDTGMIFLLISTVCAVDVDEGFVADFGFVGRHGEGRCVCAVSISRDDFG